MSEVAHGSVLYMFLPTIFTEAKPNFQMGEGNHWQRLHFTPGLGKWFTVGNLGR